MRIGIISDTHIPTHLPGLPAKVKTAFKDVVHIFHAGDIESMEVLEELASLAPVTAVAGNMDSALAQLPFKQELIYGDHRIGLIHGFGWPRERIRQEIRKEFIKPTVIVYGHTHRAFMGYESGIFFFNPGTAAGAGAERPSVGILTLHPQYAEGEIVVL